ncbi:MAG TPA: hypothetical protein VHA07_02035 [Devosia sp.]|nr:hypothetical protein [Devosia sp.]
MGFDLRIAVASAGLAALAAGGLAVPVFLPQALAEEPQSGLLDTAKELFPPSFDPGRLKRFDITYGDSVSTKPLSTTYVSKISFGRRTQVAVVTTATGTYSSDGLASPNVRYPGIDVAPKHGRSGFTYSSFASPYGSGTWTSYSSGSFTYYTYNFTPTPRK